MTDGGPTRQCVVCHRKRPRQALLRIVGRNAEEASITLGTAYLAGRGTYLCPSCAETARRRGLRSRSLRLTPDDVARIITKFNSANERTSSLTREVRLGEAEAVPVEVADPRGRRSVVSGSTSSRLLGLLGLAYRASRLRLGRDEALRAIRAGRAPLALLANDAGSDLRGAVETTLQGARQPDYLVGPSKMEIGQALGRRPVGVVVVTDLGFARALRRLAHERDGDAPRNTRSESESG
jgi:predicted RNA-binding protein YlxR (DUF448 family)/ribosomal protein L7Ae-like RNA K-turn-binding protein